MAGAVQLFYELADADCAAARRAVLERGLKERVDFRNLFYPEVVRDLDAHRAAAGAPPRLPALWDGARLHQGLPDVLAALDAMGAGGAAS